MDINLFFSALKKVMPNIMERLNPPATDEQIIALKAMYDFEIDPLYLDFLKICDGEKDTLMVGLGVWMVSIERSNTYQNTEWMDWHSLADNPHLCKDQYFSKKRISIMEDGGGSCWFLDYDPAPEGKMGQVICVFRDQPETVYNCFDSFEDLLLTIIEEIELGNIVLDETMQFFNFTNCLGHNYCANKSATYHKNKIEVPENFFTNLSPEWLAAVSNATHNPIINRDGITAKPQEALAVKEICLRDPKMMDTFVDVMQYLPNLHFLYLGKEVVLEEKHYEIIKKLRLHSLTIHCPVNRIADLTNKESLRSLSLSRMYEADINEITVYKNLVKLDIQRKNDLPSLAFLEQMQHVEELQLWHEELTIVTPEDVVTIGKMPKLSNLSTFKTKPTNFDDLILRPSPFFSSFIEEIGFVR
jgi:cell wall assembly regulator SMI1